MEPHSHDDRPLDCRICRLAHSPVKVKTKPPKPSVTYKFLVKEVESIVEDLRTTYNLKKELVENIVSYAKCLVKPGTEYLDELVFAVQMSKLFDITEKTMLGRMYAAFRGKHTGMSVPNYARCICTMITPNVDIQAQYVFRVYDTNDDGSLTIIELFHLLKPCVMAETVDDDLPLEPVRDIMEIAMTSIGFMDSGVLNLKDYLALVKKDILHLQLFGKCLPNVAATQKFVNMMTGPSPQQVRRIFRDERKNSMMEIDVFPPKMQIFPFHLDLP